MKCTINIYKSIHRIKNGLFPVASVRIYFKEYCLIKQSIILFSGVNTKITYRREIKTEYYQKE